MIANTLRAMAEATNPVAALNELPLLAELDGGERGR
jgi:hypothetical protein